MSLVKWNFIMLIFLMFLPDQMLHAGRTSPLAARIKGLSSVMWVLYVLFCFVIQLLSEADAQDCCTACSKWSIKLIQEVKKKLQMHAVISFSSLHVYCTFPRKKISLKKLMFIGFHCNRKITFARKKIPCLKQIC